MKTNTGFIEGVARLQATLFPELFDDYINDESSIRVIDMFVDNLDLAKLEFKTIPAKKAALVTILPPCSSYSSTFTLIAYSHLADWNENQVVMLS